ncbi:MAG: ATP-binding protein, partial [Thermomicrobiales bacterium]
PLTNFVGREHEVARLEALLHQSRLLTLVGIGGVGKTRLALRLASEAVHRYPDGVCLVELAALAQPDLIDRAVASALGIAEVPGQPLVATLAEALRPKRLLLVLDNCEHLAQACAELAHVLLRAAPELCILTTSREPLGVDGETTWPVPPLALGNPQAPVEDQATSAAVRLFVLRTQAARPDFTLTEDNTPAVVAICRALDGIPLALELAAARVRVLGPAEVLGRLGQALSLLAGGSRTAPERQRTFRAALDWSYELLNNPERRLLERLAVFAGGWTLDAAEAVCAGDSIGQAEVLPLLASLAEKSLVVVETGSGPGRYRLLEPVRQYAAERLAAREAAAIASCRDQHAAFVIALARRSFAPSWEASAAELQAAAMQPPGWLERVERDHDNVRAALTWLLDTGRAEDAQRLGAAFWQFWSLRGYLAEGRRWLRRILDLPDGDVSLRIRVLLGASLLALRQDDLASASTDDTEALRLARETGDRAAIAVALYRLGDDARTRGELATARTLLEAALEASRLAGNPSVEAWSRFGCGNVALAAGEYAAACTWLAEALASFRRLGIQASAATTARRLGVVHYLLGDRAAGRSLLEEGLAGVRRAGDQGQVVMALWELGAIASTEGDFTRARALLTDGLQLVRERGDQGRVCWYLEGFARLATAQGQVYRALRLASAATALGENYPRHASGWHAPAMALPQIAGDYAVLEH